MHYLRCSSCGHYNEIKSEYQVFCTACSKKLENNFTDWKKQNSENTYDEYKQLVCTTERIDSNVSTPARRKIPGLKYWIGFALAFALFYALGQFGGDKLSGLFRSNSFDKALMESANEINKSCPIMIDKVTRLDNAIALPDNVFQYNYTLIDMKKESIDLDELISNLTPVVSNFVKTSPEMQTLRDNKVTVNYYYKDISGNYLFTISVGPEVYNN